MRKPKKQSKSTKKKPLVSDFRKSQIKKQIELLELERQYGTQQIMYGLSEELAVYKNVLKECKDQRNTSDYKGLQGICRALSDYINQHKGRSIRRANMFEKKQSTKFSSKEKEAYSKGFHSCKWPNKSGKYYVNPYQKGTKEFDSFYNGFHKAHLLREEREESLERDTGIDNYKW